jgi:hypothetical protein
MKLNAGRVGFALVAVIALCGIVVTLLAHHSKQRPASRAASPAAHAGRTAKTPSQSSSTVHNKARATKRAKTDITSDPKKKAVVAEAAAEATDFLKAYYLILPSDTEASRRERIAQFVPKHLLAFVNVGLGDGSAANKARIKHRLTQIGKVVVAEKVVARATDSPGGIVMAVPVVVTVRRPNGSIVNRFRIQTNSEWSLIKGHWQLVDFQQGGDTG